MKNIKFLIVAFLSVGVLISSCRKDKDFIVEEIILNEGEILGTITGQVLDERNLPIENASVFLNDDIQTTDEYGFFIFKDKALQSLGTVVKVQAASYVEVSKIVNPKPNAKTILNIKLIDKKLTGTVNAITGGSIEVNKGSLTGQINFEENAFVLKGSNTAYTGEVQVYAGIINPANDEDILAIPGDLRGLNTNKETVQLASFSMLSVLIETSDGQELELANDKEAVVTFPVDLSIQANAPSTIPLWHYNIETGHWEEEGSAELIDNHYVGKVSHFSFWNCDAPFPIVQISGRVVDEEGMPLAGITVGIRIVSIGITGTAITNTLGEFSGGIPSNENLEIIFSSNNQCLAFSASQKIGSFAENVVLEDIIVTLPPSVSGVLLNCEGEIVQDGFIVISTGDNRIVNYPHVTNGFFKIPTCFSNFTLIGLDYTSSFKSELIVFESQIQEDTNIGEVILCSENDTYFTINYQNEVYKYKGVSGRLFDMENLSLAMDTAISSYFFLSIDLNLNDGEIIGNHKDVNLTEVSFSDKYANYVGFRCNRAYLDENCNVDVEIISAQPLGGYIMGTYEGNMINDSTNETDVPISGTFKALSFL